MKLHGKKIEKTDDPEILHFVPNLFAHHRDDIDFQLQYGGTFGKIICITRPDTSFFWLV